MTVLVTDPIADAGLDRQEAADRKRWLSFLRQALGHDEDAKRRRG